MHNTAKRAEEIMIILSVFLLFTLVFLVLQKTTEIPYSSITGEVLAQVNVIGMKPANCDFTLQSGLNLVSFFCITNNAPVQEVIGGLTSMDAIYEYQKGSSDAWKIYNPNLPSGIISDLIEMNRANGYWIRMNNNENLFVAGGLRVPNFIPLTPGWNLLGYPTNKTKDVNTSFASIEGNFSEARKFDAINDVFVSYRPGFGGGLNETKTNEGYWINSTIADTWIVD